MTTPHDAVSPITGSSFSRDATTAFKCIPASRPSTGPQTTKLPRRNKSLNTQRCILRRPTRKNAATMEGSENSAGSSDLPRLRRHSAAEQTAMATAVGLFQPSPREDSDVPAMDAKMTKGAGPPGVAPGVAPGVGHKSTPSTSLKRRSSYSNMRMGTTDSEDSTPGTPASQMITPPKDPPAAPQKARLLRPNDEQSLDVVGSDTFAFQLRTRLDNVFEHATYRDGE